MLRLLGFNETGLYSRVREMYNFCYGSRFFLVGISRRFDCSTFDSCGTDELIVVAHRVDERYEKHTE